MPFLMIRNDITKVTADAIVNPANRNLLQGSGTSRAIYQAAGEQELTAACEAIGYCEPGRAVCTPAFGLPAKYIFHAVCPAWQGGCGGGANIKTLLKLCPNGKVQGIDYSAVSVEKARKVNARTIAAGRCTVQQASVVELPFEAEQFDVVTAFETVYFWPELAQNFREVYRVLKPGGVFFICNEANGETTKDDKWTQIIDGMTIYTDTALKEYLEKAGFCQIQSHKNKKGWLCVTAQKR